MPNFKADDTKTEAQSSQSKAALLSSISSQAPADLTPLPLVGSDLVARGYSVEPVPYHRLHRAVMSGAIAAQRNAGGRIGILRGDYPAVAAALGLVPAAEHVPA